MPTYNFYCDCGTDCDVIRTMAKRDDAMTCAACKQPMKRRTVHALVHRISGRIPQGGGPDRFTADMLGIPLKELPSGLKADDRERATAP